MTDKKAPTITIAHLSDIHFSSATDHILGKSKKIGAAICASSRDSSAIFLVLSGDIANKGLSEEYTLAKQWIVEIKECIKIELSLDANVIVAPGNHDCDFSSDQQIRNIVINEIRAKPDSAITDTTIDTCIAVQKNFNDFRGSVEHPSHSVNQLFRTHKFIVDGKTIGFDVYNTAWISTIKEVQGSLIYPSNYARDIFEDATDLVIAVFHHPFAWLTANSARSAKRSIRQTAAIVLTGHEHYPLTGINADSETGLTGYVEGGVLQEKTANNSSFNLIKIDFETLLFSSTTLHWSQAKNCYLIEEEGAWSSILPQLSHGNKGSKFCPKYLGKISDVGGALHHPSKQALELWDIFVYPDLSFADETEETAIRSARTLTSIEKIKGGVLLKGGDKAGKSALLHAMFESFAEQG